MSSLLYKLAWAALIATLAVALLTGAFLVWGLPELIPAGTQIVIDGERFDLDNMQPAHPVHWLMASMGVLVAAAVIVVVVPLVVTLAVGVPLLMGALGVAVALLALALVMSPLMLLLMWLWKDPKKQKPTTMSA
jgi:hypothetical protein